jgi:hypothetical protein
MLPDGRCVVLSSDSHDGYWKERMHRRINITKRVCSRSTASIIMGTDVVGGVARLNPMGHEKSSAADGRGFPPDLQPFVLSPICTPFIEHSIRHNQMILKSNLVIRHSSMLL